MRRSDPFGASGSAAEMRFSSANDGPLLTIRLAGAVDDCMVKEEGGENDDEEAVLARKVLSCVSESVRGDLWRFWLEVDLGGLDEVRVTVVRYEKPAE